MFVRLFLFIAACLFFVGSALGAGPFEVFLDTHCLSCHGPDSEEGGVRLDQLSRDFKSDVDTHHWVEVIERVNAGEMPPEGSPKPTQKEIAGFVMAVDSRIKEGRAARMAARPAVAHYRLSRREYQNTVYDLLGVRYDPTLPGELNEDTLWYGYERIGSELSLSPSHVDRYYRAAEVVLDRAFPAAPTKARKVRVPAAELRYHSRPGEQSAQEWLDRFGIERPLRYLLFPIMSHERKNGVALSPRWFGSGGPPRSGLYRMRMSASGVRPIGGQLPHLRIGKSPYVNNGTPDNLIEFDVVAPEDEPEIYEFDVYLEMPNTLYFDMVATSGIDLRKGGAFSIAVEKADTYIFTHSSEARLLNPTAPQIFDDKGGAIFPTVLVDWIEWEGPLETEAEKSLRNDILPSESIRETLIALLPVLFLQLLLSANFRHTHPIKLLLPAVRRLLADSQFPVHLLNRHTGLGLLQSKRNLAIREPGLLHGHHLLVMTAKF
ncbi:Planctomycete cytochrome C [Calycomorphotria hydatis]|uniref:Planctomycete cytochrome C n=1 Tax=Calycomorphotria hydatis TaxID=2528027 RepID=A0A517T5D3_9PLAN|nr:Planctomycete cytochrome C [Calycomorphotria hydatis]